MDMMEQPELVRKLHDCLGFGEISVHPSARFGKDAVMIVWLPGDKDSEGRELHVQTLISDSLLENMKAQETLVDFFGAQFLENRLHALSREQLENEHGQEKQVDIFAGDAPLL